MEELNDADGSVPRCTRLHGGHALFSCRSAFHSFTDFCFMCARGHVQIVAQNEQRFDATVLFTFSSRPTLRGLRLLVHLSVSQIDIPESPDTGIDVICWLLLSLCHASVTLLI